MLLRELEDTVHGLGYAVDTGLRQHHAMAFYWAEGYAPIGNFNSDPVASWIGEKPLG